MSDNALGPFAGVPPLPPTLEQEIRRLIAVHGADAVKQEIKTATKPRRGRRALKEGALLRPWMDKDARDWLDGRDPFALRKNKAIARALAKQAPRTNVLEESRARHFERQLALKREYVMLLVALDLSEREYPFTACFRVLEALAKVGDSADAWARILALRQEILGRYREVYGEPDPAMTWAELEARPRYPSALEALLGKPQPRGGLFGTRG